MRERIRQFLRIGPLGRNALLGTTGLGVRAAIQAAYLVLLSRWLGAQGYGLFSGWVAIVMLVAPLSGWGIAFVLAQVVARDRATSRSLWSAALIQIVCTGSILAVVVTWIATFMPGESVGVVAVLLLGVAELIILPVAQAAASLCFALDLGVLAALAICLVPAGRLLIGLIFFLGPVSGTPSLAAFSHFCGSLVGGAVAVVALARLDGVPSWRERTSMRETLPRGSAYATGALVGQSYQEVDKALMLQLLGANVVGPYTAAFRVVSVFALPVSALVSAALPKLFAAYQRPGSPPVLKAIVTASAIYGLVAAVAVAFVAPLTPHIFGSGFSEATRYLFLLSPWPILFALHQCVAMGLTTSGHQQVRVLVEGAGLVLIVSLNLLLLRRIGATASILALLAGEALMALVCWWVLSRARRMPVQKT